MLKVILRTEVPEWCLFKGMGNELILFKQIWLDGNSKIKGVIAYKTKRERKVIVLRDHHCDLAKSILYPGSIVVSAMVESGQINWTLVCTQEELTKIVSSIDKLGLKHDIVLKTKFSGECCDLTYLEERLLRFALEAGYLDSPKRIKLEDLARKVGLSKSAASVVIRRAIKKILQTTFF
ncbi:hypothetical protein DRP04_03165 [Archaeoglobales archaeon]|nr:MAG: hypothetical protein DRP04_03165 [Archaeoglobales archaeon]